MLKLRADKVVIILSCLSLVNKNHLKKAIAFFGFCGIQYGGPKIDVLHPEFVRRQGNFRSKKLFACSRDPNSLAL